MSDTVIREGFPTRKLDNQEFELGTGGDTSMVHDGTDTIFTQVTGNLVLDSTVVTGKIVVRLGTDTSATAFEVRNNSDVAVLSVDGGGAISTGANQLSVGSLVIGSDVSVSRQAANVAELGSGDSFFSVGAASIGRRNASADANPTTAITANGLEFGAGGASATDVLVSRTAANTISLASGDTLTTNSLSETTAGAGITLGTGAEIIGVSKVVSTAISYNTADGNVFSVPASEVWLIEDMWFQTAVDWDGNGAFIVGDTNDADGFLTLANASLDPAYDESGGIAGWPTGSRGLDSANRGVYLTTAVTLNKRMFRAVGPYNVVFDNTPGTSTAGSGTLYMRYTRLV